MDIYIFGLVGGDSHETSHILSIIMQMENAHSCAFLPMELAVQYYHKWNCDILCVNQPPLYYKCLHGTGSVDFKNGNTFQGCFHHGLMTGNGVYRWKSGITYTGSFSNNTVTGSGNIVWPDGSTYIGEVLNGHRHGQGTYDCKSDNSIYNGGWLNGLKDGRGLLKFENNSVYEGDFKNGKRHGQGRMKYQSGNYYQGGWKDDHKVGEGTMIWGKNQQKYTGGWDNDQQEGQGSYCWFDSRNGNKIIKTVYKGGWKQGKRNGFGAFFYNNGCRFEGYFQNNHKHGKSILTDEFGDTKIQAYHHDRPIFTKTMEPIKKKEDTQIVANPYPKYIDIQSPLIDASIHNFLLRQNSRLIGLYRSISSHRDHYTGVTLDGLHRLFKEARVLDQYVTLAAIDRQFALGKKHLFSLDMPNQQKVILATQYADSIQPQDYSRIELISYRQQLEANFDWYQLSNFPRPSTQLNTGKELTEDIHEKGKIILYRHFVTYLLHFCLLRHRYSSQSLREILENLLESLNGSEHTTQLSEAHTMKSMKDTASVPEEYSMLNKTVLEALNAQKPVITKQIDHTANVRQIYILLCAVGVLKETNQRMHFLQRIERSQDIHCCVLRRQNKHLYAQWEKTVLTSPEFTHLMNYQLLEGELDHLLFVTLTHKITTLKEKEELQKKYKDMISSMVAHITSKKRRQYCGRVRHVENEKDRMKRELLGKLEEEEREKAQIEGRRRQEEREEQERKWMGEEDMQLNDSFDSVDR